jgi:branched-chain amino acid transport system ATP-binding protein
MLEAVALEGFYGRAQVLHGVSLAIGAGELVVLLGRNGAGKSTLIKSLIGLVRPRTGTIRFMGQDITALATFRRVRLGLGYVPEERRVFPELTVAENLDVGRRPARDGLLPWTTERLLGLFPRLGTMQDRPGARMSGGEQQMLAIARTLMGNPRLLLLDEPSEGLAPIVVQELAAAIRAIKADGIGILLAEQNLRLALAVADRALAIETGRIVWSGTAEALRADPAAQARFLGV